MLSQSQAGTPMMWFALAVDAIATRPNRISQNGEKKQYIRWDD